MSYEKGDRVVAVKDIGGVARDFVAKGTKGVVTETSWGSPSRVLFRVEGLFGDKSVEISVTADEVS